MSDEQRNASPCPDAVWTDMWSVDLFYNLANYHPAKESRSAIYYKIFRTPSRIFRILRQIVAVFSSAKFHRQCLLNPMLPHTQNMPDTVWHIVDRAYMDLKERYDTLQQRFFRECMCNDDLHDRIDELTEQNKHLTAQNKQSTQDLETIKQVFGKDQVEVALESANSDKISDTTPQSQYKWSKMGAR